ncbi:MAG: hypothetical protein H6Q99_318 [Proteobacteria bacterium]|nr:hypothetical protein [Pseudomonadota bacterium]
MPFFREKNRRTVEAIRWDGENTREITLWVDPSLKPHELPNGWWLRQEPSDNRFLLVIGEYQAEIGDWVVKGPNGCLACSPHLFAAAYEAVPVPSEA